MGCESFGFGGDFFCGLEIGSSVAEEQQLRAGPPEGIASGACVSDNENQEGEASEYADAREECETGSGAEGVQPPLPKGRKKATTCRVKSKGAAKSPLKWHGGKHFLASFIVDNLPPSDQWTHYLEPYAGGLSVLFALPPGKSETVNDLNSGLSDFWYVLANTPDRMLRALWGTPLSQDVWQDAHVQSFADGDRVKRATAFFIRYRQSRQGLGKDYCTPTKRVRRGMNENVSAWLSAVDGLQEAHERLRRVEVRNMDALNFIRAYDHEKALFYLDPPYMHETRKTRKGYDYEMTDANHLEMLDVLTGIKGKFALSGYPSALYEEHASKHGWRSVSRQIDNKASSRKTKEQKTEMLWMNY